MESNKTIKESLLLPKSEFSIDYNNEQIIEIRKKWEEIKIYHKLLEKNKNKRCFILHEGPTFSNNKIHIGHVLNHILKDIIVRSKTIIENRRSPFVLGWDNHGLPIEHEVLKKVNQEDKNLRFFCREFALKQVDIQREQMAHLGLLTDYNKFYLTLENSYESQQIRIFGEMVKKKIIYLGRRPLYWSCSHQTTLAENEVEYLPKKDTSLYFKVKLAKCSILEKEDIYLLVWTTQAWTIPANKLIAVKIDADYALIQYKGDNLIILKESLSILEEGTESIEIKQVIQGQKLLGWVYFLPYDQKNTSYIVNGSNFIKKEEGTGIVHLAPAFGLDDFNLAKKEGLEFVCPIDTSGYFNEEIKINELVGQHYSAANDYIINFLEQKNLIVKKKVINHSYPHDWRDKSPLIYRLTEQWFIRIEDIKKDLLTNIEKVKWYPEWNKEKSKQTIAAREDWCISRQRKWGVPLPIFYRNKEPILEPLLIKKVSELVKINGSDGWFDGTILETLKKKYPKLIDEKVIAGTDTMDVWLDSGITHVCVLKNKDKDYFLSWPADLYLEGGDQHRGWFSSSLITSVILFQKPPYKGVLTHGFVVDERGHKMSKSLGNVVSPEIVLNKFGPDTLRLWAGSVDYTKEIKISDNKLIQIRENYKKIRNTLRFLLGNLYHLPTITKNDLKKDLELIDYYILQKLKELIKDVQENYKNYRFSFVSSALLNFCINDLSSFYFEISKDSLYCDSKNSLRRKQLIVVFYHLLDNLLTLIGPIMPFLAEEIYQKIPISPPLFSNRFDSVFLKDNKQKIPQTKNKNKLNLVDKFFIPFREDIFKVLEMARGQKIIIHNNQAVIDVYVKKTSFNIPSELKLSEILLVSKINIRYKDEKKKMDTNKKEHVSQTFDSYEILVHKNEKEKRCIRCKKYRSFSFETCLRCQEVLKSFVS